MSFLLHHLTADLEVLPPAQNSAEYETATAQIIALNDAIAEQYAALRAMRVPVLVIREPLRNDLHEIFQRLNSGTRLSDLDLIAAEWRWERVDVTTAGIDASVKNRLIEFAQSRISETYDQEEYEYIPDLVELAADQMSMFDLLYALGKFVAQKHRLTFEGIGQSADRLAIFVAALLFAGGIGRRRDLVRTYPTPREARRGMSPISSPISCLRAATSTVLSAA